MTILQLAAVLLCALYVSDASYSVSSPRCCTQLGEKISEGLLKRVKHYSIQRQDGTCHLQAVLLQVKNKTLCVSPKNKRVQDWIKENEDKRSGKQQPRKNHPGSKKRRDKPKNKKKEMKKQKHSV